MWVYLSPGGKKAARLPDSTFIFDHCPFYFMTIQATLDMCWQVCRAFCLSVGTPIKPSAPLHTTSVSWRQCTLEPGWLSRSHINWRCSEDTDSSCKSHQAVEICNPSKGHSKGKPLHRPLELWLGLSRTKPDCRCLVQDPAVSLFARVRLVPSGTAMFCCQEKRNE